MNALNAPYGVANSNKPDFNAATTSSLAAFLTEKDPLFLSVNAGDRYPQADEFRPERFLGEEPPDTYSWIPFGGGTRRCLGASFATFEMRTVIKRVLERAELRPVGDRPEPGVRKGITFVPKHGARAVLEARR